MKNLRLGMTISILVALTSLGLAAVAGAVPFSVKEYDAFHEVLHPLEHEALPAKDFQRIRANAAELLKRGAAIVRLGVPQGTAPQNAENFRRELKKFEDALGKFRQHSQTGTDEQLEVSFSAVHDSFEMLAGMLPQK
jgi:hypothetical protein